MSYTVNNTRTTVVSTVNNGTTAAIGGVTLIGKTLLVMAKLLLKTL